MRNKILELLSKHNLLDIDAISKELDINKEKLEKELKKMVDKGILDYNSKTKNYQLFSRTGLLKGQIVKERKTSYIKFPDDSKTKLGLSKVEYLRDGDLVSVEPNTNRVIKVYKKSDKPLIGELNQEKGKYFIVDKNSVDERKIYIDEDETKLASIGHIVLVENNKIIDIIAHKDEPDKELTEIFYEYGFNSKYNLEVLKEVEEIPTEVAEEEIKNFVDLRDRLLFTIDGSDTKDIDDSLIIEKLDDYSFRLICPIALVRYYLKDNSAILEDMIRRGTSCYAANKVVAMLHPKLSNGICSLNPNTDRLASATYLDFDLKGNITNVGLMDVVINSKKQMSYTKVNMLLEENKTIEDYQNYKEALLNLAKVSEIYHQKLKRQGFLEFISDEVKFKFDENNNPYQIIKQEQRTGENIIQYLMLLFNHEKTKYLFNQGVNLILRVHDEPNQFRQQQFFNILYLRGYLEKKDLKKKYTSYDMQKALEKIKGVKEEIPLNNLGIRAQSRARFSVVNIGHHGTTLSIYGQFSSPIRRGGDAINQKIEDDFFKHGLEYTNEKYPIELLEELAEHFTKREMAADECERKIKKKTMAKLMNNYLGQEFEGVISGVTEDGLYVLLDNAVEGFIGIRSLDDDNYLFDEYNLCLLGRKTAKRYLFGDTINIRVKKVNIENNYIDFEEVKEIKENEKKEEKKKIKNR